MRPAMMRPAVMEVSVWAVWVALAGCGLGITDDGSGGAADLPTQAAGPYRRIEPGPDAPLAGPIVLGTITESFEDPSALPRDGGGYRLWFGYVDLSAEARVTRIRAAAMPSLYERPVIDPTPAIEPSQPWEGQRCTAPDVIERADGTLVMFYEAGEPSAPAIGRADSTDGGRTWRKHASNPVLVGLGGPSVVVVDDQWWLFGTDPRVDGIVRADSRDGVHWARVAAPVVTPRPEVDGAFDRFDVGDPFVVAARTAAGRLHLGMFFRGAEGSHEDADVTIGYAGSFDGTRWERFAGLDPVLIERGWAVYGPSVVVEPTRGVMFFHEVHAARGKILVATHP